MVKKQEATMDAPTEEIVSHHEDPMLAFSEAGLLVGRTRETIRRWVNDGLLKAIRDPSGLRRIRKSELIRFYGASALAEVNPINEAIE